MVGRQEKQRVTCPSSAVSSFMTTPAYEWKAQLPSNNVSWVLNLSSIKTTVSVLMSTLSTKWASGNCRKSGYHSRKGGVFYTGVACERLNKVIWTNWWPWLQSFFNYTKALALRCLIPWGTIAMSENKHTHTHTHPHRNIQNNVRLNIWVLKTSQVDT